MLSHLHATLSEMFRHRPGLAAEVCVDMLGLALPPHREARVGAAEVRGGRPTELHADAVVSLEDGDRTVAAVIVEVQLRIDEDKRWSWPLYVASVRRRCRAPTVLLVVCVDASTARWAATPIDLGHDSLLRPAVLGPGLAADGPGPVGGGAPPAELAVLSVLARAEDPGPTALSTLDVLVDSLSTIPVERALDYASLVLDALPERARAHLEVLLSAQPHIHDSYLARRFRAEGEAHGRAEGEASGRVAILLRILERRGIPVPEHARATILGCSDLAQLELWSDRALTAVTVEDVLARP